MNRTFVGCLAKALETRDIELHAVVVLSNHYHLLVSPRDVDEMSRFMRHLNTNLSKELTRLRGWRGKSFETRYRAIAVSQEPEAQIARLEYLLRHGVKERLVRSPLAWSGVHCARVLSGQESVLRGAWVDRTQLGRARRRKGPVDEARFTTEVAVPLAPLPCWRDVPTETWQSFVRDRIEAIEQEARRTRPNRKSPRANQRPERTRRSPCVRFHAWNRRVRRGLEEAYGVFLAAFRAASARLASGDRTAPFPPGSFPPGLPFVPTVA